MRSIGLSIAVSPQPLLDNIQDPKLHELLMGHAFSGRIGLDARQRASHCRLLKDSPPRRSLAGDHFSHDLAETRFEDPTLEGHAKSPLSMAKHPLRQAVSHEQVEQPLPFQVRHLERIWDAGKILDQ